jgi:ribosomal protein S18 acetylase RimI-like enzyme
MKMHIVTARDFRENTQLNEMCGTLARLHLAGSPDDLMSRIGESFLKDLFYRGVMVSPGCVLVVAVDKETVVGFLAATLNMRSSLRQIAMSRPFKSLWYGFRYVFLKPKLWKPFIDALHIGIPSGTDSGAEILMVMTSTAYRGQGVGKRLLLMLNDYLKEQNTFRSIARVRADNLPALVMYEHGGYREVGSITFDGIQWKWLIHELPERRR